MSDFNTITPFVDDVSFFNLITSNISSFDFTQLYNQMKYQGFNRSEFLSSATTRLSSACLVKIAILGAVRGSNYTKINQITDLPSDVRTAFDNGVITRVKPVKSTDITITRCTAAMPQWVAYALLTARAPGRMASSTLEACLQFPAAGSLPMSKSVRQQHIRYSDEFSKLIGGHFQPTIYKAMYNDRVKVAHIHPDVRVILGVNTDDDGNLDIDQMLEGYEDVSVEEEVVQVPRSGFGKKRRMV